MLNMKLTAPGVLRKTIMQARKQQNSGFLDCVRYGGEGGGDESHIFNGHFLLQL